VETVVSETNRKHDYGAHISVRKYTTYVHKYKIINKQIKYPLFIC